MSQENVEIVRGVRIPLPGRETRRHRTLDERIIVRFPALARQLSAAWARLPRHSRLRRAILARRIRQAYAALNRRDFDVLVLDLDPGIELRLAHLLPDTSGTYHGHDGFRGAWGLILEVSEDIRLDPQEALDFRDYLLITAELRGRGAGSGVPIGARLHQVSTLRRGLVVRQHDFVDRAAALEAVGLSE
jgi:ketosteroid isomerase-like protein